MAFNKTLVNGSFIIFRVSESLLDTDKEFQNYCELLIFLAKSSWTIRGTAIYADIDVGEWWGNISHLSEGQSKPKFKSKIIK